MEVPLLDLKAQYRPIKTEIDEAVAAVFESQYFIMGPQVAELETAVAVYSQCRRAIGVSSGTDALLIALMAEDIGPGDEVITTPYTFFATAGCISRLGAKPVFVDIDRFTYNLVPSQVEAAITKNTRAIIPVHLFGQMADMDAIMEIADKHNLIVIEDAAQAIGAESRGRRAGSMGHYGCFSFFPSKNLGGGGDGGMVVTNDEERADKLVCLRNHGSKPKYYHKIIGGNFRLDTLQAAIVGVKLGHLDAWSEGRQKNAVRYDKLFHASGLVPDKVRLPKHPYGEERAKMQPRIRHIFNQYVIRVGSRNALRQHLRDAGIGNEVYYPLPLHMQECFAYLGYKDGDFPESEKASRESLALPIYPELSDEQAAYVVDTIAAYFR